MSEACVKALKRDYTSITVLPGAANISTLLADWIEDYREVHSQPELKFRSPGEFIRLGAKIQPPPVRQNGGHSSHSCGTAPKKPRLLGVEGTLFSS
ncbi:hypothetical protein [Aureimonas glaciei]|uniref:Uncharacterized protein n=1 Tax=Aureimonas glaciei TaxID=1776957 RepID=A0A916YAZ1_9HYPH|nr:hypothetical protein [Aureimonas glaciei]GGD37899.1 hypothetical protein GCM10011335_45750 [Aureimonas glaciei]